MNLSSATYPVLRPKKLLCARMNALRFDIFGTIEALLSREKIASLLQWFNQLDSNHDGKIDLNKYLHSALEQEKTRLIQRFQAVDTDKDGNIEFEEFVTMVEPNFQILKKVYELVPDWGGMLSLEEALQVTEQLALPLNRAQLQIILDDVDHDGDGQISYYEYLGAIAYIGFQ